MRNDVFLRREFLVASVAAVGMASRAAASEGPVVKTTAGKLRGTEENGVVIFKGVPYAGPSEGANRFKAPTKLEPWTGVRDAVQYGPQAIQNRDPNAPPNIPVAAS